METAYQIIPAGFRPFYILLPVFLLLAVSLALLAAAGYGSQRAAFVVSDAGLNFRGEIYGRRIPWTALRASEARMVEHALLLSPQDPQGLLAALGRRDQS